MMPSPAVYALAHPRAPLHSIPDDIGHRRCSHKDYIFYAISAGLSSSRKIRSSRGESGGSFEPFEKIPRVGDRSPARKETSCEARVMSRPFAPRKRARLSLIFWFCHLHTRVPEKTWSTNHNHPTTSPLVSSLPRIAIYPDITPAGSLLSLRQVHSVLKGILKSLNADGITSVTGKLVRIFTRRMHGSDCTGIVKGVDYAYECWF